MAGKKNALFDSNIIIYLSKREIPLSFVGQFDELFISVITYMEILGYPFSNPKEEHFINEIQLGGQACRLEAGEGLS